MTKKYVQLIFITLSFFILTACSQQKQEEEYGIPWEKDLTTAFKHAKKENKNVMIMAVSKGCGWCKKMKQKTLSNPIIAKRLKNYILVQADRETPSQKEQLPPFNHVPILFFMTPNKEVIDNMRGYYEVEDFLEYLNEIEDV